MFHGTERFFRPGYAANPLSQWIPAMEGVAARLQQGARIADVGCGHGASIILMAQAYPASSYVGFDYHAPSIARAREAAIKAGLGEQCASRWQAPRIFQAMTMTWSRCSIACTTWAIRSALQRMSCAAQAASA
ncbi:class I SAM-dependent methyltransferase [Polaromonas sp.]|uniref:class I SAM-dependent methyltransferase n=1 Tax=Polaromonas sp. TaxID=1869339 RepID=UPI0025E8FA38|nr:class I SAM-dependent methyltransferase [Polaromonas sp.]